MNSIIGVISVRLTDRHILALYMLAFHPILHKGDICDEREKFLKTLKTDWEMREISLKAE